MNWYPKQRKSVIKPPVLDSTPVTTLEETREVFKMKRDNKKPCPLCIQGMLKDAKTGKLRDCVLCNATGTIQYKKI